MTTLNICVIVCIASFLSLNFKKVNKGLSLKKVPNRQKEVLQAPKYK